MIKVHSNSYSTRGSWKKQLKTEEGSQLQFPAKAAALNYEKSHAALIIGKVVATPNRRCTWAERGGDFFVVRAMIYWADGKGVKKRTHTQIHDLVLNRCLCTKSVPRRLSIPIRWEFNRWQGAEFDWQGSVYSCQSRVGWFNCTFVSSIRAHDIRHCIRFGISLLKRFTRSQWAVFARPCDHWFEFF